MKYKTLFFLSFLLLFGSYAVSGQNSGTEAFTFLQEPVTARLAALGTDVAAVNDNDINIASANPSLITPEMNNDFSLAYVNYFAGLNYGLVQFSHTFEKAGSFLFGIQFMSYGEFDYADASGNRGGTFSAADYAINVGWGRKLNDHFSIGATGKFIYSYYETYNSVGLAVDVAGTYQSATNWIFSLTAANVGLQLKPYVSGAPTYPLPFNLSLSLSKRLEHMPFRFFLVYNHIEQWKVSYYDSISPPAGIDPITGEPVKQSGFSEFTDDLMRHFVFGGELLIGKHLVLRGSYNYRRRKELSISQRVGMVGFSWGLGLKISHFRFDYSRSTYHRTGSPNYFTLSMSLDEFRK
ncbi:type IX secretion system protein PorQ [Candidatus Sulfidibacterium hydrothermale]|uniref:type IX secretion system protein PorQ n=1 Tax=Candidatus Sulfidibacterium hydrothermale TaxID=2875962 RepID=UPI001F0A3B41|nr:type IX secretion system protein PorQ [Candidatus Sulfidibacterium hydrothermale]UBM61228.1 type IX secretion system protein PorQ [Candidatus Sulfidibacterium hydrothermale]